MKRISKQEIYPTRVGQLRRDARRCDSVHTLRYVIVNNNASARLDMQSHAASHLIK